MINPVFKGLYVLFFTAIFVRILSLLAPDVAFAMTNTLIEGMYLLAFTTITVRLLVVSAPRLPIVGKMVRENAVDKTAQQLHGIAFIAALWGTAGVMVSFLTGAVFFLPGESLRSPIVMNKVMVVLFAATLWMDFLVLHTKGEAKPLRNDKLLPVVSHLTAFGGLFLTVVASSLGGSLTGIGLVMEPVYALLHSQKSELWLLPTLGELSTQLVNSPLHYLITGVTLHLLIGLVNFSILILVLVYLVA